ncbi:MAG TPA: carboxymuconolactone decarboxylase family protein [Xanthobacteraceae bacterium]|nr:carboxymuconolactone decarboxylase family protein [Xanthobacteraceae bacterium]
MPAKAKRPRYRLKDIPDEQMNEPQRALRDAIFAGPRGKRPKLNGPFAIWLHAPHLGLVAQALGAHVRFKTSLPPRLSEFAILTTGQFWRAQYEWFAHAPMAERAGVLPKTIADLKAGRVPKSAPKDERALYDFIKELYRARRVSDRTYDRAHKILGDAGMVEFVATLGYYVLISMTLNVFHAQVPEEAPLPFREGAS